MPKKPTEQILARFFTWNLFQRDGVFYADGRQNRPSLGKHSLGTRDREAAMESLRQLDQLLEDKRIGRRTDRPRREQQISITEGWERYFKHVARPDVLGGAGRGTRKRYSAVRDKHQLFCEQNGVPTWNCVDKQHVTDYGSWLKHAVYADATVRLECTLLKQVIKWLIEEEKALPETHRIKLPIRRSNQSSTYCYSRTEVKAMIDLCNGDPKLRWLGTLIVGLVSTGMRIGEAASLRWSDVDAAANTITIKDTRESSRHESASAVQYTKGRRTRRVPIHPYLGVVLKKLNRCPDGLVFHSLRGCAVNPDNVRAVFIRDVIEPLESRFPTPPNEIGFRHGRIHSFRHCFISEAFLGGAGEGEIREWVGHADSQIVERYRHLRNDDAQRKMAKISFVDRSEDTESSGPTQQTYSPGEAADNESIAATSAPDVPDAAWRNSSAEIFESTDKR